MIFILLSAFFPSAALRLNPGRCRKFFLGGAIHDVAQVVGAGYMISPKNR